jgi:hypothetical protein
VLRTKKSFTEETYVIEDSDKRLCNFLKEVSGCYKCPSSHSVEEKQSADFGIDLEQYSFSPPGKKHILCFQFKYKESDITWLFVKPENYGTKKWGDFKEHSGEFIGSVVKRRGFVSARPDHRKKRLEYMHKDLKKTLKEIRASTPNYIKRKALALVQKQ